MCCVSDLESKELCVEGLILSLVNRMWWTLKSGGLMEGFQVIGRSASRIVGYQLFLLFLTFQPLFEWIWSTKCWWYASTVKKQWGQLTETCKVICQNKLAFLFLHRSLYVAWNCNSLCRPSWPWFQRFSCLSAKIKIMHYHTQKPFLFINRLV